jgi:hypothetical protein
MKLNKNQFFTPKAPKPPSGVSGNELDEMAPAPATEAPAAKSEQVDHKPNPDLEAANRKSFF